MSRYLFLLLSAILSLFTAPAAAHPVPQEDAGGPLSGDEQIERLRTRDTLVLNDLYNTMYQFLDFDAEARAKVPAWLKKLGVVADSMGAATQQAHVDMMWSAYYDFFRMGKDDLSKTVAHYRSAIDRYRAQRAWQYLPSAQRGLVMTYVSSNDSTNKAEELLLSMIRNPAPGQAESETGLLYGSLLEIHFNQGNFDKALQYARKANEMIGEADDYAVKRNLGYIVSIYHSTGKYREAIAAVDELEERFPDGAEPGLRFDYMSIYRDRGKSHLALGNKRAALADFNRSVEVVERFANNPNDAHVAYYDLGAFYAEEGQDERAKKYLEAYNADQIKRAGQPHPPTSRYLRDIAVRQGDYETAYAYEREFSAEQRKRDSLKMASLVAENLIKFEVEEREQLIAEQSAAIAASRRRLLLTIGGLIAALAIGVVFYLLARRLRRRNAENEQLVAEKETLIGEIHHRVKNNLQVISSLLQLQSRGLRQDDHQAKEALRESQGRVHAMGLIHQKLYQGTEMTSVPMAEYLRDLGDTLLDAYRLDDRVEIFYDVEPISLDVDTAIPLGLITNELVTNALKYAFPGGREGTIEIGLLREETGLVLSVTDNGVGQDTSQQVAAGGTGFGTDLVGLLTQKIKGRLRKSSADGYGTAITFPAPALG